VRIGRRLDELREQDPRTQEPEHDDPISQHPKTGLHLAMEKLEEGQRIAAEDRKKKAAGKSEAVAQPLHTAENPHKPLCPIRNTPTLLSHSFPSA
jgi:hypothetical protein